METKPLLFGIIGLILGGLIVSIVATFEAPKASTGHEMTMTQMTEVLKNKKGNDYDKAFLEHMIDHHQAAVDMAKLSNANAKHDEVKKLSGAIIQAQENEINEMKLWQSEWGYSKNNNTGM